MLGEVASDDTLCSSQDMSDDDRIANYHEDDRDKVDQAMNKN